MVDRKTYSRIGLAQDLPNLLEVQLESFYEFLQPDARPHERKRQGLQAIFQDIFPIEDVHGRFTLDFVSYRLGRPKYTETEAELKGVTYAAPLKVTLRLISRGEDQEEGAGEIVEQEVFLGDLPMMTGRGTFIINGVERVVVSQLHRSPGVYFTEETHPSGKRLFSAKIIPHQGAWIEFTSDANDILYVSVDRRKKFPATMLLRGLGFGSTEEILGLLFSSTKVSIDTGHTFEDSPLIGSILSKDVICEQTGQVLAEAASEISPALLAILTQNQVTEVSILEIEAPLNPDFIVNTLRKEPVRSEDEAADRIYQLLRATTAASAETAKTYIQRLFLHPRRYNLSEVGRYKLNLKLNLDIPLDVTVLTQEDLLATIRYLMLLQAGKERVDDIDHLGNRRVRRVGELMADQFSVALTKMRRAIQERMILRETSAITPQELVNVRLISSIVMSFFASSQLSQFMEQTNPLAELTHKRRLSALGPGGLTRETAGFEVRDVHHSHYGRICPIETPEGPNIGLISSLSTYARVDNYGFIVTPYRKVIDGRVTDTITYLSADKEDTYTIAQANAPLDSDGRFSNKNILSRRRGDFPIVPPQEVDYMDVSPMQLVSVAAALIPFLEHDDANRALMGSNMQRQAVPLLRPESPIVGTGIERWVAEDSGVMVLSKSNGIVSRVTASEIVVQPNVKGDGLFAGSKPEIYPLTKFKRTNQDTCINQRPIVKEGDRVRKGQVIADGQATEQGELALGTNVLVAFMPWAGYNFEDAIVVSERLLKEDLLTSIHIQEFETQARETKLGPEEITAEIPNVSEEATRNLDENGIIRIGAEVHPEDILVGKVSPKGETELTPEERLLRAIFGEKASDVRDSSLRVPPGVSGVVLDVRISSRRIPGDAQQRKEEKKRITALKREHTQMVKDIIQFKNQRIVDLLAGHVAKRSIRNSEGKIVIRKSQRFSEKVLTTVDISDLDLSLPEPVVGDSKIQRTIHRIIDEAETLLHTTEEELENEIEKIMRGDELPHGVLKRVKVYIAQKRTLSVGDKTAGRHGNKGVVAKIVPEEDMPFLPDGTPVDMVLNPLGVPSRMNVGQILEAHLGWAAHKLGIRVGSPVFDGATIDEVKALLKETDLPLDGKTVLRDGRTGELLGDRVTVGYMYMMKLLHMVDDKIHARSIGPYSLITQQPLGGKAQFGGQRFGEMEVWALEAYGAAHTLQEMLTVKSDDVAGRSRLYEAIVKGENPPEPGLPASFNVLVKELNGLCLDVELEK
jgi:DNA-directed RNA polymerase subunit beta